MLVKLYLPVNLFAFGWIADIRSFNTGKGCQRVRLRAARIHDIDHVDTADEQRVGDKRSMIAPGDGFSAHDH